MSRRPQVQSTPQAGAILESMHTLSRTSSSERWRDLRATKFKRGELSIPWRGDAEKYYQWLSSPDKRGDRTSPFIRVTRLSDLASCLKQYPGHPTWHTPPRRSSIHSLMTSFQVKSIRMLGLCIAKNRNPSRRGASGITIRQDYSHSWFRVDE